VRRRVTRAAVAVIAVAIAIGMQLRGADTASAGGKRMFITVDDGKTFVSDKDSKSWTVSNPDSLKGHEGHQVTVTANVDADKSEVTILTVKMIKTDSMK